MAGFGDGTYGEAPYGGSSGGLSTPTATADQVGSGSFSATAAAVLIATGSITGTGVLAGGARAIGTATAPLAGSGAFTATSAQATAATGSFTGAGAFSASVVPVVTASAVGTGTFAASVSAVAPAAANLTGAGAFSGLSTAVQSVTASLVGSGDFSAAAVAVEVTFAPLSETAGDFSATAIGDLVLLVQGHAQGLVLGMGDGFPQVPKGFGLRILDDTLEQTPDMLEVVVAGAQPGATLTFTIDGVTVLVDTADSLGDLYSTPIFVDSCPAGVYSLLCDDGTSTSFADFTVAKDPDLDVDPPPTDGVPTVVPGSTGVRKWVLQDAAPGGLGSWQFPINPTTLDGPEVTRDLNPVRTTYVAGKHSITEGSADPFEWTLHGYSESKAEHDMLLAWGALNRRFWLIDHRDRAWKVTFSDVKLTSRKRAATRVGSGFDLNDWVIDYEITVLVFSEDWVELT